jgi:hypothetical protein
VGTPVPAPTREISDLDNVIDPFAPETVGTAAAQLYGNWVNISLRSFSALR